MLRSLGPVRFVEGWERRVANRLMSVHVRCFAREKIRETQSERQRYNVQRRYRPSEGGLACTCRMRSGFSVVAVFCEDDKCRNTVPALATMVETAGWYPGVLQCASPASKAHTLTQSSPHPNRILTIGSQFTLSLPAGSAKPSLDWLRAFSAPRERRSSRCTPEGAVGDVSLTRGHMVAAAGKFQHEDPQSK